MKSNERLNDLRTRLSAVEAERDAARAGEARAVEALRRIHEGATRQLAEPRSVLDDDQYALTAIATECEAVTAGQIPALDWLAQQRAEAAAKAERCAENAALRKIVVDLHWMARRYADGRMSTAPEMFNDAVKALLAMGIKFNKTFDQIIWARNSMGRRYDGLTNAQATPGTPEALGETAALCAGKGGE